MTEGEALVALLHEDLGIARVTKELDELPEKRAILQLRHKLAEIAAVRDKAREYCEKAERLVARANDETAAVQAKIDAEQDKVLSGTVSNPKELANLTRELDALRRKKEALENQTIGLMEKAESGSAQLAKVEAALVEGAQKEAALIAAFQARGGDLQTEIGRMKARRAAIAAGIAPETLARYETLRESKHGIAVGVLRGDMCSACRTDLPADSAQALHAGPEVAECPNCRRILVIAAEEAS